MRYKKLSILAIFLLCLIAIGTVSAADSPASDIAGIDNSSNADVVGVASDSDSDSSNPPLTVTDDNENLNANENDNVLADAPKSFKQLNEKINGDPSADIIYLKENYSYYYGYDDGTLHKGIVIDRSVTIDGNNHTIDGAGLARIFRINADNVVLKNIIFVNGKNPEQTSNWGGAILWYGNNATVSNCYFINNTGSTGGAICFYNDLNNSYINATFINNTAEVYGAAIGFYIGEYLENSVITGTFIGNNVTDFHGGAIQLPTLVNVTLSGKFINNTAKKYGGAIYVYDLINSNITGNFTKNSAEYGAGAIDFNQLTNGSITGSFINNSARDGGAIHGIILTNASISGDFINNSADYGGANSFGQLTNVSLSGNFINNTANGEYNRGGGVNYFFANLTNVNLSGNYINNKANNDGGVNYFRNYYDAYSILTNVNISGDYTNNKANYYGGVNYFYHALIGVDISGNYTNNTVTYDGGVNYFSNSLADVDISGSYRNNKANNDGGVNYFYNAVDGVDISGNFIHNSAVRGSASYFEGMATDVNVSAIFINNTGGSVFYIENGESRVIIQYSIFLNSEGYNVYSDIGTYNIQVIKNWFGNDISNYDSNYAKVYGIDYTSWYFMDIDMSPASANITLNKLYDSYDILSEDEDCKFPNIDLTLSGENLIVQDTVTLENGFAEVPIALETKDVSLTASYDTFSYTRSQVFPKGDFEYLQDMINEAGANSVIELDRNFSYTEGLDTIREGILIRYDNVTIIGNGFTIDAAGKSRIFKVTGDNIVLKDVVFVNGISYYGGAVYWQSSHFNISDCYFVNNTAVYQGGANYFNSELSNVNITGNFINNSAQDMGGANIFFHSLNNVNLIGNFINNKAPAGSANYFADFMANVTISGIFINNTDGEAIYIHYPDLTTIVQNSIFLNNEHDIKIVSGDIQVVNNWFGNDASNYDENWADVDGFEVDNWYFLDIDLSSPITTISLNSLYNASNNDIAVVDDCRLPSIDFTLTCENFTAPDTATIENGIAEILISPESKGMSLTATYDVISYTESAELTYGSFDILQDMIIDAGENSVIELDCDYNYIDGVDTITEGIILSYNNVTINGNGFTINANDKSRIFQVLGDNVTIYNLTFANAKSDGNGGAIYWQSSHVNVSECYFVNNSAAGNGGAIYFSDVVVDSNINAVFINNTAADSGGANYFYKSLTNVILASDFIHNRANGAGAAGGANYFSETLTDVVLSGDFINNSADCDGGANYFYYVSNVNISGNFINNTVNGYGGANLFNGLTNNLNVSGRFINNKANFGGANFFQNVTGLVMSGNFTNNSAFYGGGANYFGDTLTDVNITSNFINNNADSGGANCFMLTLTNVNITGKFINNTAVNSGGANLFVDKLGNVILAGEFANNSAARGGANYFIDELSNVAMSGIFIDNAGESAIYLENSDLTNIIQDSIFINNTGFNIILNYGEIQVTHCWFGNNASNYEDDLTKTVGIAIVDWYFLDIDLSTSLATISLNNLFNASSGDITIDDDCNLPTINLTLTGENLIVQDSLTLENGIADVPVVPEGRDVSLTASLNTASYTKSESFLGDFDILQDMVESAGPNGVISLERNYTYIEGVDDVREGIVISYDNMTIVGNGFTIDAKGKSRIFNVLGNGVNITDVVLVNGSAENGGAIFFASENETTNININATFINNYAMFGGAICFASNSSNVNLSGVFINNTAEFVGGAISFMSYNSSANVNVDGVFIYNSAANAGGAVVFNGVLTNSSISGNFINNTVYGVYEGWGGANAFGNLLINVTLSGNFTNNKVVAIDEGCGGANYFMAPLLNVNVTGNFTNNTALVAGANFFASHIVNVTLSGNFVNNSATSGGANAFYGFLTNVTLSGNFTNNGAEYAGANYFEDDLINVTLSGNFTNNRASDGSGGANFFEDTLTNVNITANFTSNSADSDGGANFFEYSLTNVTLSGNFVNNFAEYGGANSFEDTLTDVNITANFNSNVAYYEGGANYFSYVLTNVVFTGNFTNNTVYYGEGGANYFSDALNDVVFTGNFIKNSVSSGDSSGGANYFSETLTDVVLSGDFINNSAGYVGGANVIYYVNNVNITGNFINNSAGYSGGANAIYYGSDVNIAGNFINNSAECGGANYFEEDLTNVNITANFTNNSAEEGAALYIKMGANDFIIKDSKFIENHVIGRGCNGGAIYVVCDSDEQPSLIISNTLFEHNIADGLGGAIFAHGNMNVNVSNSVFIENKDVINLTVYGYKEDGSTLSMTLDDNWWGSNDDPIVYVGGFNGYEPTITRWAILTATNDVPFVEGNTVKITVSLDKYTDGETIGDLATPITIPRDVIIETTFATIDGVLEGGEFTTDYAVPAKLKLVEATVDDETIVLCLKEDVNISAVYDDDAKELTVTLLDNATGQPLKGANVVVKLASKKYNVRIDATGKGILPTEDIAPGSYVATLTYKGNGNYSDANTTLDVVLMGYANISAFYDSDANEITVSLVNSISGKGLNGANVVVKLGNVKYNVKIDAAGQGKLSLDDATPGSYVATVTYKGGDKYYAANTTVDVAFMGYANISAVYDADAKEITVTLVNSVSGKALKGAYVVVKVGNVKYKVKIEADGQGKVSIADANPGNYTATVTYKGGTKYYAANTTVDVTVIGNANISAVYDEGSDELAVTLVNSVSGKGLNGANVVVNIDGDKYNVNIDAAGQGRLSLAELAPGSYTADVSYKGSAKYEPVNTTIDFVKI